MAKAKKTKQTLVTFLLDRSGSMASCKPATIEGFNAYVETLKAEKETAIDFTFLTFDTGSLDKIYIAEPIANVVGLTDATYLPRGGTPLVDAAVKTIRATEDALKIRDKKTKVVIAIQTDGEENSSTEHTTEELRGLIEQKTKDGWEFLFMGAGVDAYSQAQQYGIGALNTMSYDHTKAATIAAAFSATASNTAGFGAGRLQATAYTGAQRGASGDKFWLRTGADAGLSPAPVAPTIAPKPKKLDLTKAATPAKPQRRKTVPDITL